MGDSTELTQDELEAQHGEQLPEREAMSIVDLGDPGTMTAAPLPIDSADVDGPPAQIPEDEGIPTREVHNPSEPPF